jgi:hypothetical protein
MPPEAKLKDGHANEPQDDKEGQDRQDLAFHLRDGKGHADDHSKAVLLA